jgi:hypothetical protein
VASQEIGRDEASGVARFGVIDEPTRASVDSTATNPHVGTSKSQEHFVGDPKAQCYDEGID